MGAEQIDAARIAVGEAQPGTLLRRLSLPAVVQADRNRVSRVPAKVIGTVFELKKRLGDPVAAGEVIATLESREVADAKSEFIAAHVNNELQQTLFAREQTLWDKKVTAEQRLLRARATQQEARVRRDLARQKLMALGVAEQEVDNLAVAEKANRGLERYDITAPSGGRIVEQFVDLGTPVGGEGQAKELYAIADLTRIWVEVTVSTVDLPQIKEGQRVVIRASGSDATSGGEIIFTSPTLNPDTRSARVIASIANNDGFWRLGAFVTADVTVEEMRADVVIPKTSLQTVEGKSNVFVRTGDGFAARVVSIGRDDGQSVEITSGLTSGERIATANTFLLKAELGKSEASHSH